MSVKQGKRAIIFADIRLFWLIIILTGIVCVYLGWERNQHGTILVEWKTASEVDTTGFNIYRADTSEGPYSIINKELIPASNDPLIGGSYQYIDRNVQASHRYYYQLEDVETNGNVNRHGPIQATYDAGSFYGTIFFILGGLLFVLGDIGLMSEFIRKQIKKPLLKDS